MGLGLRQVRPVSSKECYPFLLDIHYAKRIPSISFAFGLFDGERLEGVVTYGTPGSSTLRRGICGEAWAGFVIELNRLCLASNQPNDASFLVSRSLKLLPRPRVVVSFADSSQNHVGYVYQACNFLYCGLSAKRTDWKVRGKEHLHGQTIADEFRGCAGSRAQLMREKYGDDFYLEPRPRKHRYVYLVGTRPQKRAMRAALRYNVQPYPKGSPCET